MNSKPVKRSRNVNFNSREEELLVELVTTHKHVLEDKKTDAVMWKEKEACWTKLASEFNSQSLLVPRTVQQLQLKYKNLKKVVRIKSASIRFEHLKTGGGKDLSQALNFREEKLKSIIQLSVDGLQSEFDDDTEAISTDNLVNDNELMDNGGYYEDKDNETYYVTVMHETEDSIPSTSTNKQKPFRKENIDIDVPINYETSEAERSCTDFGASVSQWDVVTPQHIKHVKSTPLRKNKKLYKSQSAEATNLLQKKDKLVDLQIKALEQEIGINDVRKRNAILKEEKMKLEIQFLKTKINSTKH
ncbi:uncharacterized protein LOC132936123 [Metopolophium dirhodum]|uniref:uncharacterized protein LOC132936123 n=1 Tax=Metopolophium dirhodum TaxID=44670 RepID=UPI002990110D|nr:uncharacterized protein LOC132936123 [Metopolophium dirhodum]